MAAPWLPPLASLVYHACSARRDSTAPPAAMMELDLGADALSLVLAFSSIVLMLGVRGTTGRMAAPQL